MTLVLVNIVDSAGRIPENVLTKLLQSTDLNGNTPLMTAAIHEQSETLSRLLLFYYGKPKLEILKP